MLPGPFLGVVVLVPGTVRLRVHWLDCSVGGSQPTVGIGPQAMLVPLPGLSCTVIVVGQKDRDSLSTLPVCGM